MIFYSIVILALLTILYVVARRSSAREAHWDWGRINLENLTFPHNFDWGITSGIFPTLSVQPTNWSAWQDSLGESRDFPGGQIQPQEFSQISWEHRESLIDALKLLGVNSYRFGLAWADIQPKQSEFDAKVIQQYVAFCQALIAVNIQPVITLHHFAAPLWFEALGGFERRENIPVFVHYAETVFEKLAPFASRWITFHEPEVTSLQGWFLGNNPPGKRDLRLATRVLANMLDAHTKTYHRLKQMADSAPKNLQVGLTKQMNIFDPARRWHPLDWIMTDVINKVYRDEVLHYLTEGVFDFQIPGYFRTRRINLKAKGALDFIGMDYFTHKQVRFVSDWRRPFRLDTPHLEPTDDADAAIYPEGLYAGIQRLAHLKKPIWITANGIVDAADEQRSQFIRRHLYTVRRALAENYPVKGYYYYSLTDSQEGSTGKFIANGLFEILGAKLNPRPSAEKYAGIIRRQ